LRQYPCIVVKPDLGRKLSLFRDPKSVITAAGLLAEIGDNRAHEVFPIQCPLSRQGSRHVGRGS
jgi:hypothetical protein